MSHASILSLADLPPPSARRVPHPSRGDGWNTLADIEVFVFAVEAELEAMDRERVGVHRRRRKPDLSLRRRLIGLIWMLTFGGMQWRIAGWLSGIPFTTLHSAFARWARLGLWRRLGQRLALATSRSLAGTKRLGHADEMTSEPATYAGYRFPAEIISYAVWLYHVFGLSFREVELILAERGVTVSHGSIRQWCLTFGGQFA